MKTSEQQANNYLLDTPFNWNEDETWVCKKSFMDGYEAGQLESVAVLTTLVERLDSNWELIYSGEQNGLKSALLSEANELLNKMK